mmetsp:Transcript_16283/g.22835  ORF Transcript_16283/g.22835 Transcript_16283/m.22835 type:complete len:176 (-) Transcript_16283:311-838(-)|eukprot:CAMPEP_0185266284 /NCGR_PEP_ID=MMETSP1359-20130426/30601_1 /TAXON_ID=552665 /ORGANISM="Bigelowiella longifila, Strain CCMP242" /LENGTH=175 /DNA_ID=CAMNT_0027856027 /DNA_START=35 /DNA_END=562 /DNA_ORIENTATION=-
MERSEKIEKFKSVSSKEDVRVMLLSLRSDSSGLTLVAATNVFLFEPSFNFAVEQQAINRIHRIGQTKPCTVYRFVTMDTIEEKIEQITTEGLQQLKTRSGSKKRKRTLGKGSGTENEDHGAELAKRDEEENQNSGGVAIQKAKEEIKVNQLLYLLGIVKNADHAESADPASTIVE